VGDAKYNCFSFFCMEESFEGILFHCLEYGTNLLDVANLEVTKYTHI